VTDATIDVEHGPDDTIHIAVAGEIDMDNATEAEHRILDAISNQVTAVTLDLSGLDYIDSAGLRVLFTLGTRLKTLQIALQLLVPSGSPIRRVIDLSGVAAAVPVLSS
jgi:stage II sporulation protein AA (anti-sigma F factor antagonist)